MKHAKHVILGCGLLGLVLLAAPLGGSSRLWAYFELAPGQAVAMLAVFALPTLVGLSALRRPPLAPWQAGVALAGFTLGLIKFRIWEDLLHPGALGLWGLLWVAALVGGAATSAVALLRPAA